MKLVSSTYASLWLEAESRLLACSTATLWGTSSVISRICVLIVLQISGARQLPWPAPAWYSPVVAW